MLILKLADIGISVVKLVGMRNMYENVRSLASWICVRQTGTHSAARGLEMMDTSECTNENPMQ